MELMTGVKSLTIMLFIIEGLCTYARSDGGAFCNRSSYIMVFLALHWSWDRLFLVWGVLISLWSVGFHFWLGLTAVTTIGLTTAAIVHFLVEIYIACWTFYYCYGLMNVYLMLGAKTTEKKD